MSAAAKNLQALQAAIVQPNGNCGSPLTEIRMNPFEVERLDWDQFRGNYEERPDMCRKFPYGSACPFGCACKGTPVEVRRDG